MQTTNPKEPTKNKKKSRFRDFITGEIMVDKDVKSTYPFIGFVVLLFVLSILTQQCGERKVALIRKKQTEYKEGLSRLKQNNNFIPYEQNQELIKMMEERGFVKNDRHLYKVEVSSEE